MIKIDQKGRTSVSTDKRKPGFDSAGVSEADKQRNPHRKEETPDGKSADSDDNDEDENPFADDIRGTKNGLLY
ncbi:hypothetical protein [Haloplanus sp.]|uniref:hypothetical protein n=1 Tax=Haloplanus sp. TaxID=1961696 RepID=UPI00261934CF|nr:hypothetical protein [Haloplanus sp.]